MQILRNFFKFDVKLDTILSFLDKNTDQNASARQKSPSRTTVRLGDLQGNWGQSGARFTFSRRGAGPSAGRGFAAVHAAQTELVGVTGVAIFALHRANANKGRKRKKRRFYR